MELEELKHNILERLNNYKKVYSLVDIMCYLFGKDNKNMDLFQMNEWLSKIIEFYKVYGIELGINDFRVNDFRNNNYIRKYMTCYFNNTDKLDSDMFSQVVFSMPELEMSNGLDNPIINIMNEAVSGINIRHIGILDKLFKYINDNLPLSISKANIDNINVVKRQIGDEIDLCNDLLKVLDNKKDLNIKSKKK